MVWSCTKDVYRCNIEEINCLEVVRTSKGKRRFKKFWIEPVRVDFKSLNLTGKIVLDQTEYNYKFI